MEVTANSSACPRPSPRLAPRQRASSRFLFVAPPRSLPYCAFPLAPFYYVAPAVRRKKGAANRGIGDTTQGAQQVINKNARDRQGGGANRAVTRTCRATRSFRRPKKRHSNSRPKFIPLSPAAPPRLSLLLELCLVVLLPSGRYGSLAQTRTPDRGLLSPPN